MFLSVTLLILNDVCLSSAHVLYLSLSYSLVRVELEHLNRLEKALRDRLDLKHVLLVSLADLSAGEIGESGVLLYQLAQAELLVPTDDHLDDTRVVILVYDFCCLVEEILMIFSWVNGFVHLSLGVHVLKD